MSNSQCRGCVMTTELCVGCPRAKDLPGIARFMMVDDGIPTAKRVHYPKGKWTVYHPDRDCPPGLYEHEPMVRIVADWQCEYVSGPSKPYAKKKRAN